MPGTSRRPLVHNGRMEIAEHIEALRQHGCLLADASERAGLDASVPPCSPWQVKDLLRHTGYIHRWAASHITERPATVIDGPTEEEILAGGAADDELIAWFRQGHATLADTLSAAGPDLVTATFMDAPSPLAFWARRQAHETAIHRADAESAMNRLPEFTAAFAADGIDELITGFGRRRKYRPAAGQDGVLRVHATDTGGCWYTDIKDGRVQARRDPGPADNAGPADCAVSGPASGVYLFLWNRADAARAGVTVDGDPAVLARWQSGVRIRWQ